MKLNNILLEQIVKRLEPRTVLFVTRAKLYFVVFDNIKQNCDGLLILYKNNESVYFCIIEILQFKLMFDMQLYTNFTKNARFMRQQKCVVFLIPSNAVYLKAILVLQNENQLRELKRALEHIYNVPDQNDEQLSFFKKPDIRDLLAKANIDIKDIEKDLTLRKQVQQKIKSFNNKLEGINKNRNNTGFKFYGLGRQQWKLEQDQLQYLKQKQQAQIVQALIKLNKQMKLRG